MSTVVLNLQSTAMPQITNPIRVDVATQANPTVVVVTETDTTANHPARIWSFPGLPRTNYVVVMNEINAGIPVNQLAYFDVVPDSIDLLVRQDEQPVVDTTPGFVSGTNKVVFDGSVHSTGSGGSSIVGNQGATGPVNSTWTYWWTISGIPAAGASVVIQFTYDDNGSGLKNATSTSNVLANWTLTDIINDLIAQMSTHSANVLAYTDSQGNKGARVRSLTQNYGNIGVNNVAGTVGADSPDYRGWDISVERRNSGGTLQTGFEYSWDKTTGTLQLLTGGDVFLPGEFLNVEFEAQQNTSGGSVPPPAVVTGFKNKLVTTNYTISKDDFGNNLIVEPAGNYLELTLPAVTAVVEGLPLSISVFKSSICSVKIVGNVKFPFGSSIFLLAGESISIYCFVRSAGNNEYRYFNAYGNFDKVGNLVYNDGTLLNAVPANGTICDIQQHARLWQYVNSLSPNSKVSFLAWSSSQTFFSTNSGNQFYAPKRTSLYPRAAVASEVSGSYMTQMIASHKHMVPFMENPNSYTPPFGNAGFTNKDGNAKYVDQDNDWWFSNDGTEIAGARQLNPAGLIGGETRPNSFLTNLYILL